MMRLLKKKDVVFGGNMEVSKLKESEIGSLATIDVKLERCGNQECVSVKCSRCLISDSTF